MLFSKIFLASLLGAASAVVIPEGTEEGVWEHYVDANGNDIFNKLANATDYSAKKLGPYTPETFAGRFKRQADVAHCGAGNELNHAVSASNPTCPNHYGKAWTDTNVP
jgi:hypothetical protein